MSKFDYYATAYNNDDKLIYEIKSLIKNNSLHQISSKIKVYVRINNPNIKITTYEEFMKFLNINESNENYKSTTMHTIMNCDGDTPKNNIDPGLSGIFPCFELSDIQHTFKILKNFAQSAHGGNFNSIMFFITLDSEKNVDDMHRKLDEFNNGILFGECEGRPFIHQRLEQQEIVIIPPKFEGAILLINNKHTSLSQKQPLENNLTLVLQILLIVNTFNSNRELIDKNKFYCMLLDLLYDELYVNHHLEIETRLNRLKRKAEGKKTNRKKKPKKQRTRTKPKHKKQRNRTRTRSRTRSRTRTRTRTRSRSRSRSRSRTRTKT